MFYFVHTLIAILGVKYISNIYLLIFLLLISHFIIDVIPHWDSLWQGNFSSTYKVEYTSGAILLEFADALVSLGIIIFFYIRMRNPLIFLAVFISLLPDMIRILYLTPLKDSLAIKKFLMFHSAIQTKLPWLPGLLVQGIVAIILFIFLL